MDETLDLQGLTGTCFFGDEPEQGKIEQDDRSRFSATLLAAHRLNDVLLSLQKEETSLSFFHDGCEFVARGPWHAIPVMRTRVESERPFVYVTPCRSFEDSSATDGFSGVGLPDPSAAASAAAALGDELAFVRLEWHRGVVLNASQLRSFRAPGRLRFECAVGCVKTVPFDLRWL